MMVYDFTVETHDDAAVNLKNYEKSVLLIVNTASQCGYTPQYKGLQTLADQFSGQGLEILAFPCNQFGQQEPGDNAAIQEFCQVNYQVTFPVLAKIEVNGPGSHPLYQYLTSMAPAGPIRWNFTKFLFDRKGNLIGRYEPDVVPEALASDIQQALADQS